MHRVANLFLFALLLIAEGGCAHGYYSYNNFHPQLLNPLSRTKLTGVALSHPVLVPLRFTYAERQGAIYERLYVTTMHPSNIAAVEVVPLTVVEMSRNGTAYYGADYAVQIHSDPQTIGVVVSTDPEGRHILMPSQVFENYHNLSVGSWFKDYNGEDWGDWDSWALNCWDNEIGYTITISARGQIMDWYTIPRRNASWRHCDVEYITY